MKEHNKRWLISKLKTSGSKRDHIINGRFADERNTKKYQDLENLPQHESIKRTREFYNSKINTDLLKRFLRGQIGNDWNTVHSEIISRIPTKLIDYKEIVIWYVADKVEWKEGRLWNRRSQKFVYTEKSETPTFSEDFFDFYVDPETNKLVHIPHKAVKRLVRTDN